MVINPPPAARQTDLSDITPLPADQQDAIQWFSQWCERRSIPRSRMGSILKKPGTNAFYSADSIVQLLTGGRARRGENIAPIVESIQHFRQLEETRAVQVTSGFKETRLFREIESRCRKALARQRIAWIFGESQIGKTVALKEVARRLTPATAVYVEMPTGGTVSAFISALAVRRGIPVPKRDRSGLRDAVIDSFDDRMLLLVDEGHRALRPGSTSGLETFSFLRELWNRRQCGIAIALTNEGRDQLISGPHATQLAQIWRRRIPPLQLPSIPPDDDADLFADAYGLPPAPHDTIKIVVSAYNEKGDVITIDHKEIPHDLQTRVLTQEGLGVWISILQDASDMARDQRKPITWGAVIKAACQAQADSAIFI